MLDLAFVLLIIFVITTPLLEKGLDVTLPTGRNAADRPTDKKNIRVVEINSAGQYAMDKRLQPLNQIVAALAQEFQANPNLIIYVRPDANSKMKDFVALTDECTGKGISRFSIRTQTPKGR
ncbi:MAG: biopolymer transporter ExbD [Verrucomicrobiota bacterium]